MGDFSIEAGAGYNAQAGIGIVVGYILPHPAIPLSFEVKGRFALGYMPGGYVMGATGTLGVTFSTDRLSLPEGARFFNNFNLGFAMGVGFRPDDPYPLRLNVVTDLNYFFNRNLSLCFEYSAFPNYYTIGLRLVL
jgi:hypothetical protein